MLLHQLVKENIFFMDEVARDLAVVSLCWKKVAPVFPVAHHCTATSSPRCGGFRLFEKTKINESKNLENHCTFVPKGLRIVSVTSKSFKEAIWHANLSSFCDRFYFILSLNGG